jgi:hypothetical protein
MALKLVGIVDYNGQTHCEEHAVTVCSYEYEIYSIDPARKCWCGAEVGGEKIPTISQYVRMKDGVKGQKAPARRLVAKKGSY